MENKEFSRQLENRTKKFAIDIIKLSSHLSHSPEFKVIKYQITKSGTSVGANYREANRDRSRADFINKTLQEAKELLAIFSSIGKNLKK